MGCEPTWSDVEQVFAEALEQPEASREQWVCSRSGVSPAVRDEVLSLLRARSRMGGFLEAPALDLRGHAFGRYRALEEVGRGGMSVVYRGERIDGDFEKEVAIKVLLLQSPDTVRAGETQILARLEHPNIARLLDSGLTLQGFRYLVMEFVRGEPCTIYAARLPERKRLQLFVQVCAGVQAAHRAMVVHRDLKPDNILVTAEGNVKLLDFGIAKMLVSSGAGPQTTGVRAFTPDYASPEQILGEPATPVSDIYSLGVLLCELVSGQLPRLLSGLPLSELVQAANREPEPLPLSGDLAAIAAKALRRDPGLRYASAAELARDVERYLDGMPVEARPPRWSYRASRFVRRHRWTVGAATIAAVALAVTSGVAVWQAQLARKRFDQVREISRTVLFEIHDAVDQLAGSLPARKLIVERGLRYLDTLAADRWADDAVKQDVAEGYLRMAEILGKDQGGASFLKTADARTSAEKALEIARQLVSGAPHNPQNRRLLLNALDSTAAVSLARGNRTRSIDLGEEAVQLGDQLIAAYPKDRKLQEKLAAIIKQLATAYLDSKRNEDAIAAYRRSLAMREKLHAIYSDASSLQRLAEAHNWLSSAMYRLQRFAEAETHGLESYRLNLERSKQNLAKARPNLASDLGFLATLARRKNPARAIELYQEQLSLRRAILADEPASAVAAVRVAATLTRLGDTYGSVGRFPEAYRYGEEALAITRKLSLADPGSLFIKNELLYSLSDLARSYRAGGRRDRACALAREAQRLLDQPPEARVDVLKQVSWIRNLAAECGHRPTPVSQKAMPAQTPSPAAR
jgi:tetratricopeptide (TPR) repeat protein/predicted Ser/Thr protein kinase